MQDTPHTHGTYYYSMHPPQSSQLTAARWDFGADFQGTWGAAHTLVPGLTRWFSAHTARARRQRITQRITPLPRKPWRALPLLSPAQCPHVGSATGTLFPTFSFWKTGLCFISTKFRDKVCFSLLQRENRSFSRSFHQLHSILCHNTRAALQTLLCCHPPSTNCSSR